MSGKRFLYCELCDTTWRYAKLKCPHCGSEDAEKLLSLALEDAPADMVQGCLASGRYVKVIDVRDRNDALFFELEDLRTSHLDEIARRERFKMG